MLEWVELTFGWDDGSTHTVDIKSSKADDGRDDHGLHLGG